MAFDTLQVDGMVFRLHAKSNGVGGLASTARPREDWPMGTFVFVTEDPKFVIPAGYKSEWLTTAHANK